MPRRSGTKAFFMKSRKRRKSIGRRRESRRAKRGKVSG